MVADASAVIQLLMQHTIVPALEAAVADTDHPVHAPHLIDVEIANALRRLAAKAEITTARGALMLGLLGDLAIERHDHLDLLPRVWQLRANVSAYDATYVALAEALDATLFTADARLARAVGHLVAIELV